MYFITNKEGLIIAASSEFMSKVGSRDVCSLSNMLSDKLINLKDDNELSIKNSEVDFSYTKTVVHSAFGDLELYRLLEKNRQTIEAENDESIAYLRKIKEGTIVKEDNEYAVPNIPTLEEEKNENLIKKIEESNNNYKESIAKINPEDTKVEIKEKETNKTEEEKSEVKSIVNIPEIPKEAIEESYNTIKIETSTDSEVEEKSFIAKEYSSSEDKETKEEIVDIEPVAENKEKEKKQGLFSSNLFPWGKRKSQEEKLKKEQESKAEPIVTPIEEPTLEKEEFQEISKDIETTNTKEIESEKSDISDDNFLSIFKSSEYKEEIKEDLKENYENVANVEKIEDKTLDLVEPIKSKEKEETQSVDQDRVTIEDNEEIDINKKSETSTKADKIIEKIINIQVDSIDLQDNAKKLNIDLNSYKMLLNSYLSEIDKYIPQLKDSDTQTIDMLIDAGQLLSLDHITSKLSKLKLIQEDEKSSKIEEIEIFTKLLKDKIEDKSFTQEKVEEKKENIVLKEKEIEDTLIEEKEDEFILPEPKMVKIEDTYTKESKEKKEIIDITNANELLELIEPVEVNLNPKVAAEELNLPEDLIVEFIHDFLAQSKEHLPIIIESYLDKNIDKIQSTAHMLKGAANNLRLNKIADNLFKMQKETKLENDIELIKKFVAQIKGLEIELKKMGE